MIKRTGCAIATIAMLASLAVSPAAAEQTTDPAATPVLGYGGADPSIIPELDGAVAMAATADGDGLVAVASDGRVSVGGAAAWRGDAAGFDLRSPIVDVAMTPDGNGYWLVAADGGVFTFGSAPYLGSLPEVLPPGVMPDRPIAAMSPTSTGDGYWLFASDGGVFAFGTAEFSGSVPQALGPGRRAASPVVDAIASTDGGGYLLAGSDGGVFAFGTAPFHGSAAPEGRNDIIAILAAPQGYRLVMSDGLVRSYGTPHFGGSVGRPIGAAASAGAGYWLIEASLVAAEPGTSGAQVLALQQKLNSLGFWAGTPDGRYGHVTSQAVMAFQKWVGIDRTGTADQATIDMLAVAKRPTPASSEGSLIEIDIARQLIFIVRDGSARWVFNTSTGSEVPYQHDGRWYGARTPTGTYSMYFERPSGWRISHLGGLWRPKYFNGGIAIHGSRFIPGWPDSHGCARVSIPAMDFIYSADLAPIGTRVWVY